MNWEYTYVTTGSNRQDELVLHLNALGSLGWEVVGFASADPTIGINSYTAILKRQTKAYPPPADTSTDGWHPDPSRRFEQRYWDGFRWTEHVTTAGVTSTDHPNVR